ncbi:MAG: hypothetical protein WCG16_05135 [Methylococcales bacterium]
MISELTKQILLVAQKITLNFEIESILENFKYLDEMERLIVELTAIEATKPDDIRDKLLVLVNSNWFEDDDMEICLNYVEAWACRDYEFIKSNTAVMVSILRQTGAGDDWWLMLLDSIERGIKLFLNKNTPTLNWQD